MHHGCRNAALAAMLALMLTAPSIAAASDTWTLGLGFNFAGGISAREPGNLIGIVDRDEHKEKNAASAVPDLEVAAFELRLFPADDRFSIDLQWYILQTILGLAQKELPAPVKIYTQNTYFHFRKDPEAKATFAVAPSFIFAVGDLLLTKFITFGAGCRVGVDIHREDRKFAMGIYARPGIMGTKMEVANSAYNGLGFEMLAEVTWTFYFTKK